MPIPPHVLDQMHRLIAEGVPAERIAFMLRLDLKTVQAEIARLDAPGETPPSGGARRRRPE